MNFAALYFAAGIGVVVHNLNTLACKKCFPEWHSSSLWVKFAFCFVTWTAWPIAVGVDIADWIRGYDKHGRNR